MKFTAALLPLMFGITFVAVAPAPTANLQPFSRMFVSQCFSKKIFILAPPFVPAQLPAETIAQPCSNGLAFNPFTGDLAVTSGSVFATAAVSIYRPPYSSTSVPSVVLQSPALNDPRQVAWDAGGNLWVADYLAYKVYKFSPPFVAASMPAATVAIATQPAGLAIDPKTHAMFIGDIGGSKTCATTACHVYVLPAPYTGRPTATLTFANSAPPALAVDSHGRLFAGFDQGDLSGLIYIYVPPFVNNQSPAFTLRVGHAIEHIAFDASENVYAQRYDTGGVVFFNGPVSASAATPSAEFGCPSAATSCGPKNWGGLAFGP